MESLQDFGGSSVVKDTTDVNDTSLSKAHHDAAREILAALTRCKDGLSKLNIAEALLQECVNLGLMDGEESTVSAHEEELWSVGHELLLWVLATAD